MGKPFIIDKSAKSGRGSPDNFGIWCNGSTTDFGSVCPSSNLGVPTILSFNKVIMEIKTKFNIGHTVYTYLHSSILVTQIKDIKIYCYTGGEYCVDYIIFDNYCSDGKTTIPEDEIFATEKECRNSIPIKKNE